MIILVDMDEVMVNLVDKWCWYYNNKHGTDYDRGNMDYGGLGEDWIEILRIPGFHADLPWLDPECPYWLRQIRKAGHRIRVVTAAVAWESAKDKYSWVHTHLRIPGIIDGMDDLFICRDKTAIKGDVLIDDRPSSFGGGQTYTICYDQPWNQDYRGLRAYDWEGVYQRIKGIEHVADVCGESYRWEKGSEASAFFADPRIGPSPCS